MQVRVMENGDVQECAAVFTESLNGMRVARGLTPRRYPDAEASIAHLRATDPAGAFVVEDGGGVAGFAQAARREELWVLGELFVRPTAQGAGVGRLLLAEAHAYGADLPAGLVCSTPDPRALRSYARLPRFELHPMLTATGTSRHDRIGDSSWVREGRSEDLDLAARVDRAIRRGAHGPDIPHLLSRGSALLIVDDRGYAVAGDAGPQIVAALDRDAATQLLRACLRRCEHGADLVIPRIGAGHQWALQVALDAGLSIGPGGALVVRANDAAGAAYLPQNVFC